MSKILFLMVLLFSSFSYAEPSVLACKFIELSDEATLFISLDNFTEPESVELNYSMFTDYDGEGAAFSYEGDDLEWLLTITLSGDSQFVALNDSGDMVFDLDDSECDVGEIVLNSKSGFLEGDLNLEHQCSGPDEPDTKSSVSCSVVN